MKGFVIGVGIARGTRKRQRCFDELSMTAGEENGGIATRDTTWSHLEDSAHPSDRHRGLQSWRRRDCGIMRGYKKRRTTDAHRAPLQRGDGAPWLQRAHTCGRKGAPNIKITKRSQFSGVLCGVDCLDGKGVRRQNVPTWHLASFGFVRRILGLFSPSSNHGRACRARLAAKRSQCRGLDFRITWIGMRDRMLHQVVSQERVGWLTEFALPEGRFRVYR